MDGTQKIAGSIVRIVPNYVVLSELLEARHILGARSSFDGSEWYKGFKMDPPHDYVCPVRDPIGHFRLRAK